MLSTTEEYILPSRQPSCLPLHFSSSVRLSLSVHSSSPRLQLKVPSPLAAQKAATGIGPAPASWCSPAPSEHPAFVKKHNMAIRPNKNWIATKVNFQLYARLQPIRSKLPLPERLCAGSATFLADLCFCIQRTDRFVGKHIGISSQADASGTVLAERGLSDRRASPPGFSPR